MPRNAARVSKRDWYASGGFANPRCFRKAARNGAWSYFYRID